MSSASLDDATAPQRLGAVVVGGGPAGCAVLLAARQIGVLQKLLDTNLRIVEGSSKIGRGEIGNYLIRSDSLADSFLKPIAVESDPPLKHLLQKPAGAQLKALQGDAVALTIVAEFLADMAAELRKSVQESGYDPFITETKALRSDQQHDGSWVTAFRKSDGRLFSLHSSAIVIATGAHQPIKSLYEGCVAEAPLLPRFAHKTIRSSMFLGNTTLQIAGLRDRPSETVAIVGGSHSAIASAQVCLNGSRGAAFNPKSVTILHRKPLRLTYTSPSEALADGYDAFGPADICPNTGRVFPLAGFRCDSRHLLRRHWRLGGLEPDYRLKLLKLEENNAAEAEQVLHDADLIIAAMGYRPRALALFNDDAAPYRLFSDQGGPLVDRHSRVLDTAGVPIQGVFAIGLSSGYPLAGLHGEPSFKGEANGLALWQSDIGADIVSQLLEINAGFRTSFTPARARA